MENVYGLHQHTHCVTIRIEKKRISIKIDFNANRNFLISSQELNPPSIIFYNKQRTDVTGFGFDSKEEDNDIIVDNFRDGLYNLFKKGKANWDEEDYFLIKAVSDYLPLAVECIIERKKLKIENFDLLHYAFVVPSEWEEEIRDDILRPIFVQSGLISSQDHQDRLLFFTDIEVFCYGESFQRGQNTILCRVTPEEEELIIKFDLIQTTTTLFNIPDAKLFPKVMKSSSLTFPYDDIESRIKDFLRGKLFPVATADDGYAGKLLNQFYQDDQIIEDIIEGINSYKFPSLNKENDPEREPWITFKKEWMLNESQKEFINSLCPSIICAGIGISFLGYMNDIISNNFTKRYNFLIFEDDSLYRNDVKWLEYILQYNSRSLNYAGPVKEPIIRHDLMKGASKAVFEAIQHSNMYCKPRIMSSADLSTSSSVFLNSKPDAMINLDISLKSTLLACSLLNEDGSIQQIFNHNSIIEDKHLPPLGHFFTFLDGATLNVRKQFIPFAERYFLGDLSDLIAGDGVSIKNGLLLQMKFILIKDHSNSEVLVSITQQKYIKAFILMYMVYIKEEILYKLPDQLVSDQKDVKIGYAVSIEAMLLNNTLENKESLRDIIYASGLVPKDDDSKKLRITTQGERMLPAIQKLLELELSLKSYFLLCQLHEDYVQLSLHQVVTSPSAEEKYQESIIVQDEVLPIQNIYDSLCSRMWCNLLQDSSLIELCQIHNTSDNNRIFKLLSAEIKAEFFFNFKHHISDNVLQDNHDMKITHTVKLTGSCNCKVHLSTSDIIDISFTPVLQDIACTVYASLLNKKLFGNYMNVDYLFTFIRFNNNQKLQHVFAKILEEEADDFNLEVGIDTCCLVVPELFNQLLQPVIREQPLCYKDFKVGALQQVCSENYVFSLIYLMFGVSTSMYKSKITDTKTIECGNDITFPFLNKGEVINNVGSNRKFYLRSKNDNYFNFELLRFETMNYMKNNETLSRDDNIHQKVGESYIDIDECFRKEGVDIPVMLSVRYIPYTSSLQFCVYLVGDYPDQRMFNAGEPLTLTRL